MFTKLRDWLDHRTGYRKIMEAALLEHIPGGAKWRYVWGSCLAFVFMLQLITGVLLMTAYSPGDSTAWGSVYFIQYEMDFGWLIRGLHHFGSQTMVVLLGIHMLQVVIAGAHLPPRELNWWLGLVLMAIILGLSLTGYLLPWDQKGYFATQVATNILGNLPVAGGWLQKVLVGGPEYGHHTLTHFYALHVGILPPLLIVLLIAHIAVFRRHGVTAPVNAQGMDYFWPAQAFKDMIMSMIIFAIMLGLVVFGGHGTPIETQPGAGEEPGLLEEWAKAGREGRGANLDAPADPATEGYPARPEWYFLFLFQLLKYFEGDQEIYGTVVIPNAVLALLFILPLLGFGRLRKFGHFFGIIVVIVLLAGAGMLTYLALDADSANPRHHKKNEQLQVDLKNAEKQARRAVQLAHHSTKGLIRAAIPEEGARQLLRADPLTQGPRLFQQHCAGCHGYTPKDVGIPSLVKGDFKASDLGDFGSEAWIRGLLRDPADPKYFGRTELFGMRNWKKKLNNARARSDKKDPKMAKKQVEEEEEAFNLIARWLADQAKRKSDRDPKLDEVGFSAFMDHCASCHSIHREREEEIEDKKGKTITKLILEGSEDAPNFTDYGSQEWLRLMIMSPASKLRHGSRNAMPAFRNLEGPGSEVHRQEFLDKHPDVPVIHLSDIDRELIIRWLTRDYRVVFGGKVISAAPR